MQAFNQLQERAHALCELAETPTFSSTHAVIGSEAKALQAPILAAGGRIGDSSCRMLLSTKALALDAKDTAQWQQLAQGSKEVTEAVKALVASLQENLPGQAECDQAAFFLNEVAREMETAAYTANATGLTPVGENTLEGYQHDAVTVMTDIGDAARALQDAAIGSAQHLAHAVVRLQNAFNPVLGAAVGVASCMADRSVQSALLQQAKTVLEAGMVLVHAARDAGGNPAASAQHKAVVLAANGLRKAMKEFVANLSEGNAEAAVIAGTVVALRQAAENLDAYNTREYAGRSFVECQSELTKDAKALTQVAQVSQGHPRFSALPLCFRTMPPSFGFGSNSNPCPFLRLIGATEWDKVGGGLVP
jgi:talin